MALRLLRGPFTVDSFERLANAGVLGPDDRVELIDGQVVAMTPIGDRHASCVRRLIRLFAQELLDVALIDVQDPVVLGVHDAPQPDVTLLKPRADAYPHHPRGADTLLVVEVADASVAFDRDVKLPLYARSGIREVWIVDLAGDQIAVYRDPAGGEYRTVLRATRGDTITLLHFPGVTVSADEVLG